MRIYLFPAIILLFLTAYKAQAQHEKLRQKIDSIAHTTKGKVGVAICLLQRQRYPYLS
jgi:hypothetical protein